MSVPDSADDCLLIPKLWESDQVIQINFKCLPKQEDAICKLAAEEAETHLWLKLAREYKRQGLMAEFVALLEASIKHSKSSYPEGADHLQQCRVLLAEHYHELGNHENDLSQRDVLFHKATVLLTGVDQGMKRKHLEGCPSVYMSSSPLKRLRFPH